ncbi:MAG: class II glutamine amidotransferase [Gammaproteobacteria bacterium]|nr:class II glutamine amidotransferase [Gammaproteobacteria bacterium]
MCELFAMSSCHPATGNFALKTFQSHGGSHHKNGDGWGIALYDEGDARILRETSAACDSSYFDFLRSHSHPSRCVISHIRQATVGGVSLRNTQPYVRELFGKLHCFAHNGDLEFDSAIEGPLDFQPIGESDSELAFCKLLTQMKRAAAEQGGMLTLDQKIRQVREFARDFAARGTFNFFYSDGEYLFAHGHQRTHEDGVMRPPGLHLLVREDHHHDHDHQRVGGLRIHCEETIPELCLMASVPLTDEPWEPLEAGTLAVLRHGLLLGLYRD